MEFTFPIAMLHTMSFTHVMEVNLTTNSVIMFACFQFSSTVFQGVGGKYNYDSNLNSPLEDGTLVLTVYGRGNCFFCFPSVALVCVARKLLTFVRDATRT